RGGRGATPPLRLRGGGSAARRDCAPSSPTTGSGRDEARTRPLVSRDRLSCRRQRRRLPDAVPARPRAAADVSRRAGDDPVKDDPTILDDSETVELLAAQPQLLAIADAVR